MVEEDYLPYGPVSKPKDKAFLVLDGRYFSYGTGAIASQGLALSIAPLKLLWH